jgi:protease-4
MGSEWRVRLVRRGARVLLALAGVALLLLAVLGPVAVAVVMVRQAAVLVGLAVVALVLATLGALAGWLERRLPRRIVLSLDLHEPARDHEPADPLDAFGGRGRPTLRGVVESLELAGRDRRVVGLVALVGGTGGGTQGFATVQEVRDAVRAFRATGGFAVAHAETFGEFAAANAAYYLASAFDEVCLQPSGDVGLTGVGAEVNFLRGVLDRLGISPQLDQRQEYKNAVNLVTEERFTPAHREATARLVESLYDQLIAGVAEGRGLRREAVAAALDRGPLLAAEAVEAGLVDRVAYRDEVLDDVRRRAGPGAKLLELSEYRRRSGGRRGSRGACTVALIYGHGAVVQGRRRFHPLTGRSMGSTSVGAAFREAVADRRVRAIVFRVDSPGGSYVASDTIWRETRRAREAGKPVVVSMGNVAASGGYFVAMAADRIVAHPGTLTGSIGVYAGKAVVQGLKQRVGITTDEVHRGANALLASSARAYTAEQWSHLQRWLDHVYADFTAKVAQGRGLPIDRVREIARGRVWTGADAVELGLVDGLGGYPAALRAVRERLGLAADARVTLRVFPRPPSPIRRLLGGRRAPGDGERWAAGDRGAELDAALGGLLQAARHTGVLDPDGVLSAADLPILRW